MLELLILLSSDVSLYRDTFEMMYQYSWSLYSPISTICLQVYDDLSIRITICQLCDS